jgi:hypothetical protein
METYTNELKTIGYSPAKDLSELKISDFIIQFEELGSEEVPIKNCSEWNWVDKTVDEFLENNHQSTKDKKMNEIIAQINSI